jgi:hypothetical protein
VVGRWPRSYEQPREACGPGNEPVLAVGHQFEPELEQVGASARRWSTPPVTTLELGGRASPMCRSKPVQN